MLNTNGDNGRVTVWIMDEASDTEQKEADDVAGNRPDEDVSDLCI